MQALPQSTTDHLPAQQHRLRPLMTGVLPTYGMPSSAPPGVEEVNWLNVDSSLAPASAPLTVGGLCRATT